MCGSRIHPQLLVYNHVHGIYDYNAHPMAPPGIRVVTHNKPDTRPSWAPHGSEGWYIGPALSHYRCYHVWCDETRSERITDTLAWFPHRVAMPSPTSADQLKTAARDLIEALTHADPSISTTSSTRSVELKIWQIFLDHPSTKNKQYQTYWRFLRVPKITDATPPNYPPLPANAFPNLRLRPHSRCINTPRVPKNHCYN